MNSITLPHRPQRIAGPVGENRKTGDGAALVGWNDVGKETPQASMGGRIFLERLKGLAGWV